MTRLGRSFVSVGSRIAVAGALNAAVNAAVLRRPSASTSAAEPVPVLVPARDEAERIGPCLDRLVAARGVAEVIVLDDESSDDTAALARAAGARVVNGAPPPPDWLGKPWACAQLAAAADAQADVLVFVDADVRVEAGAIAGAVALLVDTGLDVICPVPRQIAITAAERLVQPLLQWSWLTFLPLRLAERSPRPSLTAATGQFLVIRRAALDRAGGFACVRGSVLDDIGLVRAVKATGGRGGVVDGTHLATCRMYTGWADLRDGYGKSLWSAFGSPAGAAGVMVLLLSAYVVPAVAMLRGSRVGTLGYAAGVASRVVAARVSGARVVPDAFAHPLSVLALAVLTARSLRDHRRGTLQWKRRPIELRSA